MSVGWYGTREHERAFAPRTRARNVNVSPITSLIHFFLTFRSYFPLDPFWRYADKNMKLCDCDFSVCVYAAVWVTLLNQ